MIVWRTAHLTSRLGGNFLQVSSQSYCVFSTELSMVLTNPDKQRSDICASLTSAVPSVGEALFRLDERSNGGDVCFRVGPFGVFNSRSDPNALSPNAVTPFPTLTIEHYACTSLPRTDELDTGDTVLLNRDRLSVPGDFLEWSDLFDWNHDLLTHVDELHPLGQASGSSLSDWQLNDISLPSSVGLDNELRVPAVDSSEKYADLDSPVDLVGDAPLLLKFFDDKAIDQMSSLPVSEKSPWRILHLPAAIITLSELTVLAPRKIHHASKASFYALLAVSAYQLSVNETEPVSLEKKSHWEAVSKSTHRAAKYHLDLSLEYETQGEGKAKYKEQLMALNAYLATLVREAF